MYAHRQIFDNPQAVIPVPAELQNHRIEVIFIQLDEVVEVEKKPFVSLAQALAHPASADVEFDAPSLNMSLQRVDF